MKKFFYAIALSAFLMPIITTTSLGQNGDWISLFDGESLEGWSVHSGFAKYRVEEGAIVGTAIKGSPNTFLCTNMEYGDFILEFEVLLSDPELNSGVQFRSQIASDKMTWWFRNSKGIPVPNTIPADRVYGYQVEIATETTGSSGGVYDEARRAFMPWKPESGSEASQAFQDKEWNKYRIECKGNSIKTWVNDI